MNTRLRKTLTLSALALLGVTMACAGGVSNTAPTVVAPRPTIGPINPPSTPSQTPSVYELEQTTTLTGASPGPATATCPQGDVALGGGWVLPDQAAQQARVFAAVLTGNTWAVSVAHPGPTATGSVAHTGPAVSSLVTPLPVAGLQVTARVECLHGAPGAIVTRRSTTWDLPPTPATESNDHLGGHTHLCDQGESLVGFGFDFGAPNTNLELEGVWPRSDVLPVPLMVFKVRNHDSVAHTITLHVNCLSSVAVTATYLFQQGGAAFAGQFKTAVMPCPTGTLVAGGGLMYTRQDTGNQYLGNMMSMGSAIIDGADKQTGPTGWAGEVFTVSGYGLIPLTFVVAAVCLSFP